MHGEPARGGDDEANSVVRMVANIFISFIGAGVLGLPYAFKVAGLMEGTIIMTAVAFLAVKAMIMIIDCKYKVAESWHHRNGEPRVRKQSAGKEYVELGQLESDSENEDGGRDDDVVVKVISDWKPKEIGYGDVAFAAFGTTGRLVIDVSLLISQIGFCCAYLIFISENLATFVQGLPQADWLLILLPPLFLLTLVPDLNNLAVFSLLAQISNLLAFAVVFWFDFEHLHLASSEHRKEFSIVGFPFFFSVAIYCFEGAGMILSLEASVGSTLRPLFKRYFVLTIVSVTTLYITFGVSGYLSYGEATRDIITLNLSSSSSGGVDFAALVKGCLCFALFFTYPIMLFPVTSLLQDRLWSGSGDNSSGSRSSLLSVSSVTVFNVVIRLTVVVLTGLVVIVVPKFADLMALVGATCCTALGFIMPGLCHLVICVKPTRARGGRQKEGLNPTMNYVMVVTGVVGAILGTFDALQNITSSK